MVRERYLSRKEYRRLLECYCGGVRPARPDTGRIVSDNPLKVEQRTMGNTCTCSLYSSLEGKKGRKRPFRVGAVVLVEGWR